MLCLNAAKGMVINMAIEAITKISETEQRMKQLKEQAEAEAKKTRERAREAGQAALDQSIDMGNREVIELIKNAEEKANNKAQELLSGSENKKAAMRARAEANLDKAASYIIERIVNG